MFLSTISIAGISRFLVIGIAASLFEAWHAIRLQEPRCLRQTQVRASTQHPQLHHKRVTAQANSVLVDHG
jgi:hypothetical protein